MRSLRVAIAGCGKIADAHAAQILRTPGCEIVAACDVEPLMVRQLYERFPIGAGFTSLDALLREVRPDVVHVTTPPASHFELARLCLRRGSHVYVEKPFTLVHHEAETLLALARAANLKLTVGHDDQFSHGARRMRALVGTGALGGPPVHMESHYGYDLGDGYARAVLGDRGHWVRRLPGQLLHNLVSHGLARIAEFLDTDSPAVVAHGFTSPRLCALGESSMVDELRVLVQGRTMTAYFTLSSEMRPSLHELRLFGPKNAIVLDHGHDTVVVLRGTRFKSYGEKFVPPVMVAGQLLANVVTNAGAFLRRDFHMKSGMHHLIGRFYDAIRGNGPAPIPEREILLTSRLMDAIFDQLRAARAPERPAARAAASR